MPLFVNVGEKHDHLEKHKAELAESDRRSVIKTWIDPLSAEKKKRRSQDLLT